MRKILMVVLMVLLIASIIAIVINGIKIGDLKINSYNEIKLENDELNKQIEEASAITSITYPEKISSLNTTARKLATVKEQYQDKIAYSTEEAIQKSQQYTEFKLSFLAVRLGNYATKEGIDLELKYVTNNSSTAQSGDLHFIVKGKYYPISEFVRDIEDDKDLYFKIENFTLLPNENNEILRAEFDVRDIILDVDNTIANPTVVNSTTNQNNNTMVNSTVGNSTTDQNNNTMVNSTTNPNNNTND